MFSLVHPERAKRKKELLVVYAPPGNVLDFLSHSEKKKNNNWFLIRGGGEEHIQAYTGKTYLAQHILIRSY